MATVNKDFKIKQGLVVEGTTATVAGNNILVENTQGTDSYITNLVGGVAYIKSVSSDFGVDLAGELTINGSSDLARTGDITTALLDYTTTANLDSAIGNLGYITGAALNGYATESYVGMQGYITLNSLSAGNGIDFNQGIISVNYGDGITLGQSNELKVNIGSGISLGASNELTVDFTGYVTETGQQTLTNKTIGDTLNFTGSGDMTINSDSHIVLTPAAGSSVKWGSDILATQTYADSAVTAHNDLTTGVHGVTGDVVGTTDTQDISSKRIIDTLHFSDGVTLANEAEIAVKAVTHEFEVKANDGDLHLITMASGADVQITSDSGDILLNASGTAYYGSASAENEIATHGYVDNAVSGLAWKQAVNLLANADVNMTGNTGTLVIDGHAALDTNDVGYRILLTNQSIDSENGIYEYTEAAGVYTLVRTADADVYSELIGAAVYVMEGTQYSSTSWVQGDHYITDFSGQDWTQFSGQGSVTAGTGIVVNGLEVSVDFTVVAEVQDLTDGLALKQDELTVGDGLDLAGATLNVNSGEMVNKVVNGVSGNSYGIVGNATYLDVTNPTGYNSEIDVDIAALESKLTTDGYAKQSDITTAVSTKADAANPTLTGSLNLDGTGDFTISADAGIILAATTESYIGSALAANIIATEGYVDSAIAGVTFDYAAMAGTYLDWSGTQFNVDAAGLITTEDLATNTSVGSDITTAIDALTTADIEEFAGVPGVSQPGPFYFTDQRAIDALQDTTPNFTAIEIDSIAKQVAATTGNILTASTVTAYEFSKASYRSAKFLVRTAYGIHTEVSEIVLTLDLSGNIHMTEYATVGTNGTSMTITADVDGPPLAGVVRLRVTTLNDNSTVTVVGTLLA